MVFLCPAEGAAARRLPCLRYGSHFLEVEICHRWTLLSVNPKFSGWKNFENRQKHQKRRSACVGQADFGKLELNNIRKDSGISQRLSVVNEINLKHDQLEINVAECSDLRASCFVRGRTRELLSLAILSLLCIHSNKQTFNCRGQRKLECRLDEHLKFTGKTSDQRKCSRSALTGAYVDKRVAGKKGSTNKIISIPPYLCRREIKCSVRWIGGPLEVWTQPLPPPGLACVMQDLKLLSFKVQWFRDMGASCFGLRFRVLCFRNYP